VVALDASGTLPADQYPEAYAYMRKIAEKVGVKIDVVSA